MTKPSADLAQLAMLRSCEYSILFSHLTEFLLKLGTHLDAHSNLTGNATEAVSKLIGFLFLKVVDLQLSYSGGFD